MPNNVMKASNWRLPVARRMSMLQEKLRAALARPIENPILIFGNQKSGTSAIASLLGAATGLRTQIDFSGAWEPFMTPFLRGEEPIDAFVRRNALAFSARIVKEPCLTFVAAQMLDHFPRGKGVFIVRDPFQNIRSILNRVKVPGDLDTFTPTLDNMPNASWVSVVSGTDLGLTPMHYVDIQAHRWLRATEAYLSAPDRYLLVRYEDFQRDKSQFIKRLAAELDLSADQRFEHLLNHQFQSAGMRVQDPKDFFGERNFERIREHCGPIMGRFGYSA